MILEDSLYEIKFEKRKEKILGYKCSKLTITKLVDEPDEYVAEIPLSFAFGKTVYELWTTRKIKLPVHALIDELRLNEKIGFPLKAVSYTTKLPEMKTTYNVTEISKN